MKIKPTCFTFLVIIVFLAGNVLAGRNKAPDWVAHRPANALYYIGIGSMQKKNHADDYQEVAKNLALRDLSSEINVHISGELVSNLAERSGLIEEEVKSRIYSSTQATLENYEQAGVWENAEQYWVYYRLLKSDYQTRMAARRQKVVSMSQDLYSNGQKNEVSQNIAAAVSYYIQAVIALELYLAEPVEVIVGGKTSFLQNDLFSSLQNLMNTIELLPPATEFSFKMGRLNKTPLRVQGYFIDRNNVKQKLRGFPVRFSFVKGAGSLVEHVTTDDNGSASCPVGTITSTDKLQIIKAQADITPFLKDSTAPIAMGIIGKIAMPEAKCMVNVAGLSVFFKSEEYQFGSKNTSYYIEPQVKSGLGAYGFVFADNPSGADLIIELVAHSRKGAVVPDYNLYSASADATISVTDLSVGKEVYKEAFSNIRDVDMDQEKAGVKALIKAGKKISDMIPTIIQKIQN